MAIFYTYLVFKFYFQVIENKIFILEEIGELSHSVNPSC